MTTVRICLKSIQSNYEYAKSLAPAKCMAVIKANAYGHDMIKVAQALEGAGVDGLAVANMNEGARLRNAGVNVEPLLILQGANECEVWELALHHRLVPMIHNMSQIDYILSETWPSSMPIWVKVDPGMHRLGISPELCTEQLPKIIAKFGGNNIVLCSHFACSDEYDLAFNMIQLNILKDIQQRFDLPWSMANSGGILAIPKSHGTWNRAGYMLYGNSPLVKAHPNDAALRPAMSLSGPVLAVRNLEPGETVGYSRGYEVTRAPFTRIATVAIGYGDGYPRGARNGTPLMVNGHRVFLAGRVSMDMITVDVTDVEPSVQEGDEVYAWGGGLSVNEVASCCGTIGYELLTKVSARPVREYIGGKI